MPRRKGGCTGISRFPTLLSIIKPIHAIILRLHIVIYRCILVSITLNCFFREGFRLRTDVFLPDKFPHGVVVDYASELPIVTAPREQYHTFYELYFWFGDNMTFIIDDQVHHVGYGDVVLVRPYRFHRTNYVDSRIRCKYNMMFDERFLRTFHDEALRERIRNMFNTEMLHFPADTAAYMQDVLNGALPLFDEKASVDPIWSARAELRLSELLLRLCEASGVGQSISPPADTPLTPKERHVSTVVAYINSHYTEQIPLETLTSMLELTPSYLCHIFRELIGMSIVEYIHKKRLVEARRLLTETSMPIGVISETVGFSSVNYFIKQFKTMHQLTPKAYREQAQGPEAP